MNNTTEIQNVKNRFGIIGNAGTLNYALSVAIQVAPTDLSVLISGESGSGKESFSKIIHGLSNRKHNNFIAINCGAIPEGTIDSELFGHVKGSFTGAIDDRKGYFEITDGGTIFLDEIGEMPLGTQARLLRVLENGEFISVGSSKVKKTNVRVIAATNVRLLQAVEQGKFREDLYYRLNTVPISVPPLRERGFDSVLLFMKFTYDFAEKNRMEAVELTDEAKKVVMNFRFPGNIRQLKNIVEQITLLEPQRTISAEIINKYLPKDQKSALPMLFAEETTQSGFQEREILYKVLFEMRSDITELKKLVRTILKGEGNLEMMNQHKEFFTEQPLEEKLALLPQRTEPIIDPFEEEAKRFHSNDFLTIDSFQGQREDVEDVIHEMEDESFSLEKKEKEMIIRALRKNRFKRKYAAEDLGISERTLYRKIKQYDIEDEK
jgi:transcriptional regulator with GAF, ATPase, and Fis domain